MQYSYGIEHWHANLDAAPQSYVRAGCRGDAGNGRVARRRRRLLAQGAFSRVFLFVGIFLSLHSQGHAFTVLTQRSC